MQLEFSGQLLYWRGPAPHYFVRVPAQGCRDLQAAAKFVTYGWGMIPVRVQLGETEWKTSLFPKDDGYLVPIKASVRKPAGLEEGDEVNLRLEVGR
jgi:Domain of unknown function (DUF1905)